MGLKEEFLELLERDKEFRYAVAGKLGLEEILRRLDRHEEHLTKLREDLVVGFRRHDEEIARLRADMMEGFNLLRRHLEALGARWGILAEEAFREGLKGLLEKGLGLSVSRWVTFDDEGFVFGYPCMVDVDIAVRDGKTVLVEVKSHVNAADVYTFQRKAELYKRKTGVKPERLVMVTPYADDKALEAASKFKIEIYTKV
jgi:hypothetical protein